jgi:hypothetical protein
LGFAGIDPLSALRIGSYGDPIFSGLLRVAVALPAVGIVIDTRTPHRILRMKKANAERHCCIKRIWPVSGRFYPAGATWR